jgi:uncharacterized membrane protein
MFEHVDADTWIAVYNKKMWRYFLGSLVGDDPFRPWNSIHGVN